MPASRTTRVPEDFVLDIVDDMAVTPALQKVLDVAKEAVGALDKSRVDYGPVVGSVVSTLLETALSGDNVRARDAAHAAEAVVKILAEVRKQARALEGSEVGEFVKSVAVSVERLCGPARDAENVEDDLVVPSGANTGQVSHFPIHVPDLAQVIDSLDQATLCVTPQYGPEYFTKVRNRFAKAILNTQLTGGRQTSPPVLCDAGKTIKVVNFIFSQMINALPGYIVKIASEVDDYNAGLGNARIAFDPDAPGLIRDMACTLSNLRQQGASALFRSLQTNLSLMSLVEHWIRIQETLDTRDSPESIAIISYFQRCQGLPVTGKADTTQGLTLHNWAFDKMLSAFKVNKRTFQTYQERARVPIAMKKVFGDGALLLLPLEKATSGLHNFPGKACVEQVFLYLSMADKHGVIRQMCAHLDEALVGPIRMNEELSIQLSALADKTLKRQSIADIAAQIFVEPGDDRAVEDVTGAGSDVDML